MTTRTIKDVDEETWRKLKALSAEEGEKMGQMIRTITDSYAEKKKSVWEDILNSGKILSDKEADDMEKISRRMRKERGFR